MPSICDNYDVLLEFTNDTQEAATIQLLRDYGRSSGSIVLLNASESVTLILESGSSYRYAIKVRTRVVSITARAWRNLRCQLSHILSSSVSTPTENPLSDSGVRVDGLFRDFRTSVWNEA
ncbi:hypothetical protein AN958_04955 [Leucoagaricus sp. SymC.cos]|nr:hypothetical protein AN958_04955 [Leucoagaricus sp. SymC.cos]